jgi:phage tail-like protein
MTQTDPLRGFRFLVEIEQIASGGFSRVKGLSRELRHESYREGGVNDYEHKLITQVTYQPIVLERGLALADLWDWVQDAANGDVVRHKITIRLQDEANQQGWVWYVDYALPVKWACTDLDAHASNVMMESIELAHHGVRRGP